MAFRGSIAKSLILVIGIVIGALCMQCRPEEEIINFNHSGGLVFERDTVLFDTVFTGRGSATKRLKIYNLNENAVQISKIELAGGGASPYQIIIDGFSSNRVEDMVLLGRDSLLVLVEVFIDPQNQSNPYLVNDSIIFETNANLQNVQLVAWGQDANYLGNEILPCNTTWTSEKPYVLYAPILVDTLCTLKIDKGTKVFAAKDAFIYSIGSIIATGTVEEPILFQNDRLEPIYQNIPGQWGGIVFVLGSGGNLMENTRIKNAINGVQLGLPDQDTIPDLVLRNVIIENMSNSGILSFTSDIYAENTLIYNCMEFNCANIGGGDYIYNHCTFANFFSQNPSFFVSDYLENNDTLVIEDVTMTLQNSIIYGQNDDELFFDLSGQAIYNFAFTANLLKTTIEGLDTLGNIINEDPEFIDINKTNYRLDTLSPAKDAGLSLGILFDLDGNKRDIVPDIGAYERIE